jgi:hypothetical protein
MGFRPQFDDMSDEDIIDYLNTGVELLCMFRDQDPESDDERARTIYATLTADNRTKR